MGDPGAVLGFQLGPGPALATAAIWGVSQDGRALSVTLPFNSNTCVYVYKYTRMCVCVYMYVCVKGGTLQYCQHCEIIPLKDTDHWLLRSFFIMTFFILT